MSEPGMVTFTCKSCKTKFGTDVIEQKQTKLCTPCLVKAYLELYNTFSAPDKFGQVAWSETDIREALEEAGKEINQQNIDKVRAASKNIADRMIERGWFVINVAVEDL